MVFVRGGVYDVNRKYETQDDNKGKIYSFKSSEGLNTKTSFSKDSSFNDSFNFDIKNSVKTKEKKKNIDIFLEEAQNIQKEEQKRKVYLNFHTEPNNYFFEQEIKSY
jgi:hypothetical protein